MMRRLHRALRGALLHVPVIGYLSRIAIAFLRLPRLVDRVAALEATQYSIAATSPAHNTAPRWTIPTGPELTAAGLQIPPKSLSTTKEGLSVAPIAAPPELLGQQHCPVCTSAYTVFVQNAKGRRIGKLFPQRVCLDCRSFFNFSGYREDDAQQKADFGFVRNYLDHHTTLQRELIKEILRRAPHIRSCCEIGSGSGTFLKACGEVGLKAGGYEINPYCVDYARNTLGVEVHQEVFTERTPGQYDLFASIGVLEHLENPRELFKIMAGHLNPGGCIYANVPFIERGSWKYLWTAATNPAGAPPDLFYDCDVHIIHYSVEGLARLGQDFGARRFEYFVSHDPVHNASAYPGILFSF